MSFHLGATRPYRSARLDDPPDLSCKDSAQADCVDVEHQPTDLVLGSPTFHSRAARRVIPPRFATVA
jgi:hypothetical protein